MGSALRKQSVTATTAEGQKYFLTDLPEEIILIIATSLDVKDLIRFSLSCRRVLDICNSSDNLWKKHFRNFEFTESKFWSNGDDRCGIAQKYLFHMKTKRNWKKATPGVNPIN
jgi:hypothetical protein